jgi:hypothetical protein
MPPTIHSVAVLHITTKVLLRKFERSNRERHFFLLELTQKYRHSHNEK